jgi:hypothetical protein
VLLELTVAEQRFNVVMEVLRDGLMVIEVARALRGQPPDRARLAGAVAPPQVREES